MKKEPKLFEIKERKEKFSELYFNRNILGVIHKDEDDMKFFCEGISLDFLFDVKIKDLPHEISLCGFTCVYKEIRLKAMLRNGKQLRFTFLIWGDDFRESYLSGERFTKEYYKAIKKNRNFKTNFEEADNPHVENEHWNALEIFYNTRFTNETTVKEKLEMVVKDLKIIYNKLALEFGQEIVKEFGKK